MVYGIIVRGHGHWIYRYIMHLRKARARQRERDRAKLDENRRSVEIADSSSNEIVDTHYVRDTEGTTLRISKWLIWYDLIGLVGRLGVWVTCYRVSFYPSVVLYTGYINHFPVRRALFYT